MAHQENKTPDQKVLRSLPKVDQLLSDERLQHNLDGLAPAMRTRLIQLVLDELRRQILTGRRHKPLDRADVIRRIMNRARELNTGTMRRVINATGVVLHTGLGRAPLPQVAQERLQEILASYTDLEFLLESGKRGQREDRVRKMLCLLTGAEDALVCNNNAAAVYLMLNTLCNRKEVIVSRGQQVEIGGGFRIPDVIRRSGCRMVEVGATNRTHLGDYADAISDRSAALLAVHTSNYRIIGFSSTPALTELVELAHQRELLLLEDLGSGALVDFPGVPQSEPVVAASVKAGADLVCFSGDKMLGAGQAGILVGRSKLIRRLARSPMMRALRCDKMTLAVLEAVLQVYLAGEQRLHELPVYRMCNECDTDVLERARKALTIFARALTAEVQEDSLHAGTCEIHLESSLGRTGSGALPEQDLPSAGLRVKLQNPGSVEALHRRLRTGNPSVVATIRDGDLFLDVKAVFETDLDDLARCVTQVLTNSDSAGE